MPYSIVADSITVWFLLPVPAINSSQTPFTLPGVALAFQKSPTKVAARAGWQRDLCGPLLLSPRGWAVGPRPARRG